jgi:hypothetical protein
MEQPVPFTLYYYIFRNSILNQLLTANTIIQHIAS